MTDAVTPFIFERRNVRGAWVEIGSGVAEMLGHHAYSPDVRRLVGESCAAVSLLAAQTTFNGQLSLQYQNGKGAVKLLVAQADAALQVRGMAKANADAHGGLTELLDGGLLGLLIEGGKGNNYQALVEVRGTNLAAALEGYFFQSEQLPTRVCLDGSADRLRGLLIQRLPARPGQTDSEEDDAHWQHLETLFATLSPAELSATPVPDLLLKLFAEEEIRTFHEKPVQLACRCSHASISQMLVSLGRPELESLLAERGEVEVTCEFCGKVYRYTPADMHDLFAAVEARARGSVKH
jgi:molecular chaperone Hsp33